jgi:hypothetical protein
MKMLFLIGTLQRLTIDLSCVGELTYVNLLLNPERYTGYAGSSARRIWDAVYSENCPKCESIFLCLCGCIYCWECNGVRNDQYDKMS